MFLDVTPLTHLEKISIASKIHILINIDSNATITIKIMFIEFNANFINIPMSSMPIEKQSIVTIKEAIRDFRFKINLRLTIDTRIMMNKRPYLVIMA